MVEGVQRAGLRRERGNECGDGFYVEIDIIGVAADDAAIREPCCGMAKEPICNEGRSVGKSR